MGYKKVSLRFLTAALSVQLAILPTLAYGQAAGVTDSVELTEDNALAVAHSVLEKHVAQGWALQKLDGTPLGVAKLTSATARDFFATPPARLNPEGLMFRVKQTPTEDGLRITVAAHKIGDRAHRLGVRSFEITSKDSGARNRLELERGMRLMAAEAVDLSGGGGSSGSNGLSTYEVVSYAGLGCVGLGILAYAATLTPLASSGFLAKLAGKSRLLVWKRGAAIVVGVGVVALLAGIGIAMLEQADRAADYVK